jgi:hypothetical protein
MPSRVKELRRQAVLCEQPESQPLAPHSSIRSLSRWPSNWTASRTGSHRNISGATCARPDHAPCYAIFQMPSGSGLRIALVTTLSFYRVALNCGKWMSNPNRLRSCFSIQLRPYGVRMCSACGQVWQHQATKHQKIIVLRNRVRHQVRHWEREAAKEPARSGRDRPRRDCDEKTKAGHWRTHRETKSAASARAAGAAKPMRISR